MSIGAAPTTDADAIERARALHKALAGGAAERDGGRLFPHAELDLVSASGLFALGVPAARGGPGVADSTLVEVARLLAVADPNIAQILQNHQAALEGLRCAAYPEATVDAVYADVLGGARLAGTSAERFGRQEEHRTRATRLASGDWELNGEKFYSTGALGATWLTVGAVDDDGAAVRAVLRADHPGVERVDDWDAIGQRSTGSGTTTYRHCVVPGVQVAVGPPVAPLFTPVLQGIHVAVQVGIARAALDDAIDFARDGARPWGSAGVERASHDPHVVEAVGALAAKVAAAEALLASAGPLIDAARLAGPAELRAARTACALARSFAITVALEASDTLFAVGGTRSALSGHAFDRHWRNARTHALQTPQRWTNHYVGDWILNDTEPPSNGHI